MSSLLLSIFYIYQKTSVLKTNQSSILFLLLVVFSMLLLAYTGYRSWALCMTHDESATWRYFREMGFFEAINKETSWHSANNHLLNTFLLQRSLEVFGQADWVIRLPNVLAHALYLGSSIFIIRQLTDNVFLGLAGWVLMNLNPYLLDFFSTARGYGLAMGFTMGALAYLVAIIKRPKIGLVIGMFVMIVLSILSNFTQFIFLAAILMTYGIFSLIHFKLDFKKIFLWQIPAIVTLLFLGLLLWQPIIWLQSSGEFKWGTPDLLQTFKALATDSVYGIRHFSTSVDDIVFYVTSFLTLGALFFGFKSFFTKEPSFSNKLFSHISLLFSTIILVIFLQKQILGTLYLINRKSLIFIPIWGLLMFCFLNKLSFKKRIYKNILAGLVFTIGIYHFGRSANFEQTREWWYDQHTLEMMTYLNNKVGDKDKINLGVHWMFYPTAMYYKESQGMDFFDDLRYSKKLLTNENYDYYYVFKSNYDRELTEGYEVEKAFSGFAYLLRRK